MSATVGKIRKDGKVMVTFHFPMTGRTIRKLMPYKDGIEAARIENNRPGPSDNDLAKLNPFTDIC